MNNTQNTKDCFDLPIKVYGPETHMTAIVPMSLGLMDVFTMDICGVYIILLRSQATPNATQFVQPLAKKPPM